MPPPVLFIVSRVLDYMDGALARAKLLSSHLGERYDQAADTLGYALMFVGVGIGLQGQVHGLWLPILAALAVIGGVSNTIIRARAEIRVRQQFPTFKTFAGFQLDDGIYLIGPATWFGVLPPFFIALCLGAAIFGAWTAWSLLRQ